MFAKQAIGFFQSMSSKDRVLFKTELIKPQDSFALSIPVDNCKSIHIHQIIINTKSQDYSFYIYPNERREDNDCLNILNSQGYSNTPYSPPIFYEDEDNTLKHVDMEKRKVKEPCMMNLHMRIENKDSKERDFNIRIVYGKII